MKAIHVEIISVEWKRSGRATFQKKNAYRVHGDIRNTLREPPPQLAWYPLHIPFHSSLDSPPGLQESGNHTFLVASGLAELQTLDLSVANDGE